MTHQAVSAVMKMTPSDHSTSQGPNSMLQNTLNQSAIDFLTGNVSAMETTSLVHFNRGSRISGSTKQADFAFLVDSASFSLLQEMPKWADKWERREAQIRQSPGCRVAFSPLKGFRCSCLLNYSNTCVLRPSEALSVRRSPVRCRSSSCPITLGHPFCSSILFNTIMTERRLLPSPCRPIRAVDHFIMNTVVHFPTLGLRT